MCVGWSAASLFIMADARITTDVEYSSDSSVDFELECEVEIEESASNKGSDSEEEVVGALRPYMFEPEFSEDDNPEEHMIAEPEDDSDNEDWRLADVSWYVRSFSIIILTSYIQIASTCKIKAKADKIQLVIGHFSSAQCLFTQCL
jgi:hypothetical protein